ncbi:MAG: helix-turn-helix domain-containing protein [Magnetococcales bacterium]|nr:helix-turn-helix domain-containing protein [Magnetococcales bacterium]
MNLQVIKGMDGQDEYVLVPVKVFEALKSEIEDELSDLDITVGESDEYEDFEPADYIQNPVALARLKAGLKQIELAERMGVSQAYISKLEHSKEVKSKTLKRVRIALSQ